MSCVGANARLWLFMAGLLTVSMPAPGARPAARLAGFATTAAIVETAAQRCLKLDIYLAETPEQQRRGLMYIEHLEEFEGMLFVYAAPAELTMWMKNTLIALDMFFIRRNGEILRVAESTTPLSTARISSGEPVTFVMELNAGFSARYELRAGNRLLSIGR